MLPKTERQDDNHKDLPSAAQNCKDQQRSPKNLSGPTQRNDGRKTPGANSQSNPNIVGPEGRRWCASGLRQLNTARPSGWAAAVLSFCW